MYIRIHSTTALYSTLHLHIIKYSSTQYIGSMFNTSYCVAEIYCKTYKFANLQSGIQKLKVVHIFGFIHISSMYLVVNTIFKS